MVFYEIKGTLFFYFKRWGSLAEKGCIENVYPSATVALSPFCLEYPREKQMKICTADMLLCIPYCPNLNLHVARISFQKNLVNPVK
jgi:hypothetical protein